MGSSLRGSRRQKPTPNPSQEGSSRSSVHICCVTSNYQQEEFLNTLYGKKNHAVIQRRCQSFFQGILKGRGMNTIRFLSTAQQENFVDNF